jgi:hypothetical protein
MILPEEIQTLWMASLVSQPSNLSAGHWYLTDVRKTIPHTFEEQRIIVKLKDENGFPVDNVPVAFSFSTAPQFIITPGFTWYPPARAFVTPTNGAGTCDQIQGSAVKEGEPGGISVCVVQKEHSSDILNGAGMLNDHTGLCLTFQLKRIGVKSIQERLSELENRVTALEAI